MSKRILFLTPQLPYPPHQGTTLRNFGLIRGLARRGHEITLLSFQEPGQPPYTDTPLRDLCKQAITLSVPSRSTLTRVIDLALGRVDMARRLWSPYYINTLRDLFLDNTFDVIHFEGIEMAAYLQPLLSGVGLYNLRRVTLVYDAHNAEHALQQRIAQQDSQRLSRLHVAAYSFIQSRRLKRFEAWICQHVDHVFACSDTDAQVLSVLAHSKPLTVVPNAITTAEYHPGRQADAVIIRPSLVFTGKMDFRPNVDAVMWFADEILPLIRSAVPEAHFTIVGQQPHARLDALRGRPGITLTGWVPSVQPYITATDVYVAPIRMGSGTRLKLLEAMALKRAVVSTSLGAEGIAFSEGEHLLTADGPQQFADAVVRLLKDRDLAAQLGENARKLVTERYDWDVVIPLVEGAYQR